MAGVLDAFSPATRDVVRGSLRRAHARPDGAWEAIRGGDHALVVAPTGSGKTLAAFLWALDRLASTPPPAEPQRRCRVLYVSPLKALAVDVERNLRAPLAGMRHAAVRLGEPEPQIRSRSAPATPAGRATGAVRAHAAGHADHHAGVAVPAADLAGPRGRSPASRR